MKKLVIVGAGGFAREVAWLVSDIDRIQRQYEFIGFVVSDLSSLSKHDSRDRVLGDLTWLEEHAAEVQAAAIGIGTPHLRLRVGAELKSRMPSIELPALIHPTAQFDHDSCSVEEGVLICAGTIGTVNIRFGPFCMVNLSCTIGHEAVIGAGAVLNPTVNISGGVHLGKGVLVGTGAQILQYVRVGEGATVGAGSVVTKNVDPGTTVVGVPAKPLAKKE
jgi:sugar O-acyltransferase (sialic acid O-acetyltransferase NeuD family)